MAVVTLHEVESNNTDLLYLISKLDQYLYERYPSDEVYVIDFSDPDISKTIFVVAYDNEMPIGCGAIRPLDEVTVELKRFFVEPDYRKQGIAGMILNYLHEKAYSLAFSTIRLETGAQQPEAISFYKKHGYVEIEKFGEYVDCGSSLCFEKQ